MSETSGGGFGGESAGVLYIDVQARMDSLESSMRQMEQRTSEAAETSGGGIRDKIGGAIGALPAMAVAAGAAIGAAIATGLKTAFDMAQQAQQGVKDFQASLGASKEEAEALGVVAQKVFANNWTGNLAEAQKAVANVRKEVQGLSDTDLQAVTEGSVAIADRFEEDQSKVAASVQALMKATGMGAKEALDFISAGFQKGLNSSGDFLDTLNEYGPQFEKAKISGSELFSLLETGAQKGALGTDKIADAFKEFSLRAADGAVATKAAYAQLGLDYEKLTGQLADGSLSYAKLFQTITDKMKGIASQSDRVNLATALFGGAGEDLGPGLTQLDMTKTKLEDLKGSADTVKAATNTLGSVFESAWRQVQVQLIPIGNIMLDLANEAMPTVQAAIARLGPVVTAVIQGLVEGWKEVRPALEPVGRLFESVFGLIVSLWNNVLKPVLVAIAPFIDSEVKAIGTVLGFAVRVVTDVINAVAALFRGDWKAAWASLKDIATGAVEGLIKGLHAADDKFFAWGKGIVANMGRALGGMKAMLLDKMAEALRAMEEKMPVFMRGTVEKAAQAASAAAGQARANIQPNTTYAGIGPRQDSAAKAAPVEAGKYGYAYISSLKDVFKNDPTVASDCASIATSIMHNLGQSIKGSVNAGVLEQNAIKAGYQRVSGEEMKAGDLVVWTSGNGRTYGMVSGKHVGVSAGMLNGKPMVINNPGQRNTQVEQMYDWKNATVYRAPNSPFAAGGQFVTQQPKTNAKTVPITVPIKPEASAKDIQGEISAKLKGIQARLTLGEIDTDKAKKAMQLLADDALQKGRAATGDMKTAYAGAVEAASAALKSLDGHQKQAQQGIAKTQDVLGDLTREFGYVGAKGLKTYTSGLQAYIAQQEKVVASTQKGSQAHKDAMDAATRARGLLADASKKAETVEKETELQREQRTAREAQARRNLEASIKAATDDRLKTVLAAGVREVGDGQKLELARAELERRQTESATKSKKDAQDAKSRAEEVQKLLESYSDTRTRAQPLIAKGEFDDAALKEFTKSLGDLWKEAGKAGVATDPLVKKAHEGAKAWGLQARAWSDAQREQLGAAKADEHWKELQAKGFADLGTALEAPKANVDELLDSLTEMRGELQDPQTVDNFSEYFKGLASQGKITKDQLELLLATMKDLSAAPVTLQADNLEGRGVQATEAPVTDAARGYLDDAAKKAYQAMLDNFDAEGKDKAQELGKMLAELIAKGFGDSDQARMLSDWIDNYQREFNTMLLDSGTVRVGVDGEFIAVSENELRGIGVQAEETRDAFLDLDAVLKNGVSMSLADFTDALSKIGLEPEQIDKLTKGWHDFNDAVDDTNTLSAVNDGLLGDQAQNVEELFSKFEAGAISAEDFKKGLQDVATALDALGEGDSAGRVREVVQNVEALTAARTKLAEAQGQATGKFDADIKALEAMRGKPGIVATELDKLIASYQKLNKQDALQGQINKWGNYAKQIIPVVAGAFAALGNVSGDTADQWASDLGSMASDLMQFGSQVATGNWVGAAVTGLTAIFNWFGRNKKAAQEAAKATADYNKQFAFSNNGYGTREVTKTSTGMLFWKTDHYNEKVDEVGKALATSLESGFKNGVENGLLAAVQQNDFSQFQKTLTDSVGQAVLKGLIDAFMQEEILKGIIGPRIEAVIKARKTADQEDDLAAMSDLKAAVGEATSAAQGYYNDVLKPIASSFGMLGSGTAGSSGSSGSLFGNAPTVQLGIPRIEVSLPDASLKPLADLASAIPTFDAASRRLMDAATMMLTSSGNPPPLTGNGGLAGV